MLKFKLTSLCALACGLAVQCAAPSLVRAETTLRVVMHSDLKIIDPIWTTAYITRNHGYMIYDTLFAMDAEGSIKPQMIDTFDTSADSLVYTLKLREGLAWHDGAPVTAEDCIASLKRWAARDTLGQALWKFVASADRVDARTFKITLKEPTALLIGALGKPSASVPFMMPKRVAETDPAKQLSDTTGSGPFIFKKDEWKPGDKAVYVKNTAYKPRAEPASGLAGGKIVHFDRVEWRAISDQQQAVNALLANEVDLLESPAHDQLPLLKKDANVRLVSVSTLGFQYAFRPNHKQKPFDDPKIRKALWYALAQQPFLEAVIGDPAYYKTCKSVFVCPSALETQAGMDGLLEANAAKAQALLKDAGYDGTPVVLLHPTDLVVLANLAPVAKSMLEKAGFKVDMQSSDWQTVISKVSKPEGWSVFVTAWNAADLLNPVANAFLNSSCEKARSGWPCDAEMEKLREAYARAPDAAQQKEIATAVQLRLLEHTQYVPLGQWTAPFATRVNIGGFVKSPVIVLWNVKQQ
jgi:peptide/nickel transport system substrate-binding protein